MRAFLVPLMKQCEWKQCNKEAVINPYRGVKAKYCSRACKSKSAVDRLRHRWKRQAVDLLGGKCMDCGYNKCLRALQFHHRDPSTKVMNISFTTNWLKIKVELEKCDLLCANCHAERHDKQEKP